MVPLFIARLVRTNKGAYLIKRNNRIQFLSPTQALVLSLCNGTFTLEEITNLISEIYKEEREKVKGDIKSFLDAQKDEIIFYLQNYLHL